jgi:hypothetical protein
MFDRNYEKDLEKYRRIKEETEQWFLDSLYWGFYCYQH